MKLLFACGVSSLLLLGLYLAISTQPASGRIIGQAKAMTEPAQVLEILQLYREDIEGEIKASGKITFGSWRKATVQQVQGTVYEFSGLEMFDTACKRNDINDEEDECFKKQIGYRNCHVKVYDPNMPGSQVQRKVKVTASGGCPNAAGWNGAGQRYPPRTTTPS